MDTESLVESQIDGGARLINLLTEKGFDITAACWVKPSEEDKWLLYIISEIVDRRGIADAHRELFSVYRSIPDAWVLLSEVKLIGTDHPIAKDILSILNRFPSRLATRSHRPKLGDLPIDEVYIYPPPSVQKGGLRQSFKITYYRQGESNNWRAKTRRDTLYRNLNAKGAVAYSTARWEGQAEGTEKFATVSVLLEVDPRYDDPNTFIHPSVWQVLTNQARDMADEMFKAHHPDAVIEHVDDED